MHTLGYFLFLSIYLGFLSTTELTQKGNHLYKIIASDKEIKNIQTLTRNENINQPVIKHENAEKVYSEGACNSRKGVYINYCDILL